MAVGICCLTVVFVSDQTWKALTLKWNADRTQRERQNLRDSGRADLERIDRYDFDQRKLDLAERELMLKERLSQVAEVDPMPQDLIDRIHVWEDEDAQESERANLYALYALLRDWDKVRQRLEPLAPVLTVEIKAPMDGFVQ